MKRKKLAICILLTTSFLISSLTGCGSKTVKTDAPSPTATVIKTGGDLKIAYAQNPRNLNPIFADDTASNNIIGMVFDGLLYFDDKNELKPKIAESMPIIKDKTITFKLKQGVKWHDGQELTSEDVKYSYELIMDKEVNSPRSGDYVSVASIDAPDKYTVVFNLKEIDSQIIDKFADRRIIPKHIMEKFDRKSLKTADFSRNPVGNGAFKFEDWKTSERITLQANSEYFLGKPSLDHIIFDITPSSAAALVKVETQEDNMVSVSGSDLERIKTKAFLDVATYKSTYFDCIQYNLQNEIFKDKLVRQAISYAINRTALIKGVYQGTAEQASSSYPSELWFSNPNVKKYDYDVAKAKELLNQAGWKAGTDGIMQKDGKKLEFTMLTNQGNPEREKALVYFQSALKEVGIKSEPKIVEFNTLFDNYVDPGKFDCYLGGYSPGTDPIQDMYYAKDGVFNAGKYSNPRIDELFVKVKQTFDKEEQKKYLYEVQSIITEEVPMTYLTNGSVSYAYTKKLKNVQFVDMAGWYGIEKWYVEK